MRRGPEASHRAIGVGVITRQPGFQIAAAEKRVGSDAMWDQAEAIMTRVLGEIQQRSGNRIKTGINPGEGCVIERTERRAWIHPAPAAVANHWLSQGLKGRPRGIDSRRRHRLMNGLSRLPCTAFDWMIAPIHNKDTRLAMVANPATGRILVQGWEADGAATAVLAHSEPVQAGAFGREPALRR